MIRQKHKQESLATTCLTRHDKPLNWPPKTATDHLSVLSVWPVASKNGHRSKTPGLHLSPSHAEGALGHSTSALPSREALVSPLSSPTPRAPVVGEGENPPPRRPLKLAPLDLPLEVKEAQRLKIRSIQREAKAAARKLDAATGDPCPRKVKACGREPPLISPSDPRKPQGSGRLLPPVTGLRPSDASARKEKPRGEASPARDSESASPSPPRRDACRPPEAPAARAEVGGPSDVIRRARGAAGMRPRLMRAQRLEEDQGRSGAWNGGLSDEGEPERALPETGRVLEKASRKIPEVT